MKLRVLAAERDFAVGEMKEMAEQCQSIAEEFQSMADYSEKLVKDISEVSKHYYDIFLLYIALSSAFSSSL